MNVELILKKIRDITRNDAGINGDAQRIEQIIWILFLKIYDSVEKDWQYIDENYTSIIPDECKWGAWAHNNNDGNELTGEELIEFVDNKLIPTLSKIDVTNMEIKKSIVKSVFLDAKNYMKNGVLLRQVIDVIDSIDFSSYNDKHLFGDIYEQFLQELQSAGDSGEFYTPRALTDFVVKVIDPKIGDTIADLACGTGGFLTSAINHLDKQVLNGHDRSIIDKSIYGIEKKGLPYRLAITNMLLHDVEHPEIYLGNSLNPGFRIDDFSEDQKFDVIIMNPPYGGNELDSIVNDFPARLRSKETADLFLSLIMYRLKENGRAAVVLPNGILFDESNVKCEIRKKLIQDFNLHTIIRLPQSVFAPYTTIATNVLFFDNTIKKTDKIWFYRFDMPDGYKSYSKTKPLQLKHLDPIFEWLKNKIEIKEGEYFKAKCYTVNELDTKTFCLDYCDFPKYEEKIPEPFELIENYQTERREINKNIDETINKILELLKEEN